MHILMCFIETRQVGSEQESAKCNQERTYFKQDPLQHFRTFARIFSNIDFFLQILPLKDYELVMSEM